MDSLELWRRYKKHVASAAAVGVSLDISRVDFPDHLFRDSQPMLERAFEAMNRLERGDTANPDEQRMVGHYWLRSPLLAPETHITEQIDQLHRQITEFAAGVHGRSITPPDAAKFTDLLIIGIGGSALGPQLVSDALGARRDKLAVHFLDNTDPDGFDRMIDVLGARLKSTLVLVVSKSGGTAETRNGMIEMEHAFAAKGVNLAAQAVAITGEGSQLDDHAREQGWLARFPMWDWVGGRTSGMSAVGLLPMALQGLDTASFIGGAAEMDKNTREPDIRKNLAARLALMWWVLTDGRGEKAMVVLPYKDRLLLMSRYLQQLVMESLGKRLDLDGQEVHQGLTVYGNKGSTDQHAYVQQLREGPADFFATFIVVLQDRQPQLARKAPEVAPGVTSGDYLSGFWQGTRQALYEAGRPSITLTLDRLDAQSLGALIALFERAVGFYASFAHINAYHQPGVEAGKKAAAEVLDVQARTVAYLREHPEPASAEQIADRMGLPHAVETIHHTPQHMAATKRGVAAARGKFRWKG